MAENFLKGKIIHNLFAVIVFIKGINGLLEIIIAILFFLKRGTLRAIASKHQYIFFKDFGGYPMSFLNHLSLSTRYFIGVYFLFYGIVNIFLAISLLRGKPWAYPAAILFFTLFLVYQFYRSFLHHSAFLFFISIFEIFVIVLTFLEYERLKAFKSN